jgi:TRAP-type C4-dicarboxylate transport system permease small subunit
METKNLFEKGFDTIIDGFAAIAGLLLVAMMLLVCCSVVMRYILHLPVGWVVEVCEFGLLFITFFGTAWLLKKNGHIKVDLLTSSLSPAIRKVLFRATCLIGAASCGFLLWYGAYETWDHFQRSTLVIQTLETPKWMLLIVIPFGSLLMIIQFMRMFFKPPSEE